MARRISIDTLGLMSPRSSAAFGTAKRGRPWYYSRPRLLTTCLFFGVLWVWFHIGGREVLIPEDSFEYLKDESLNDIMNTTLGVSFKPSVISLPVLVKCGGLSYRLSSCSREEVQRKLNILTLSPSSKRSSFSTFPSAPTVATPCPFPQPSQTSNSNSWMASQERASSKAPIRPQMRTSSYCQAFGEVGGHT